MGVLFVYLPNRYSFLIHDKYVYHKLSTDCTKRAIYFSKYNSEFFTSELFCTANYFCHTCICKVDGKRSHALYIKSVDLHVLLLLGDKKYFRCVVSILG